MKPVRIDDRLHPQLSKGRPPAQLEIDALEAGPGRTAYGACNAQEIASREALTDFSMGGATSGVAWSLNPYVGCLHRCAYCYVPDTMKVERRRWGSYVVAKRNLPFLLQQETRTKRPLTVYVSTATDPYQSVEREREVTRRCLEVLARRNWPLEVLTRSPLVLRDVDVLRRFRRVRIGLSVPTLDDEARRVLEPVAPQIASRLRALRELSDQGFTVFANYSPAYPATNGTTMGDVARAFRAAGVQWVNTSYWRRQPSFLPAVWERLEGTPWEDLTRFIASQERQAATRKDLDAALRAVGIPLRTGFFNPPFPEEAPSGRNTTLDSVECYAPRFANGILDPSHLAATADGLYPELEMA